MGTKIKIESNIVFGKAKTDDLTADVYFPSEGVEPRAALLLIHGGAWKIGDKMMFRDWGKLLAESGFVAVAINYRLSTPTSATWPGVFDDVKAALIWMTEMASEWNIDVRRIGLMGDSCGAHLATLLSFERFEYAQIRAVVGVYGVYDLTQWWEYTQQSRSDDPVGRLIGAAPQDAPQLYKQASPSRLIDDLSIAGRLLDKSFFLIWGDADEIVPCDQSILFYHKLGKLGVKVRALRIPAEGHYWFTVLPGKEGGTTQDYPNKRIAPDLIRFLQNELC